MEYVDVIEMVRDIRPRLLDSWINEETLKFTKKNRYEKTDVLLEHVPEEWGRVRFDCENGHSFAPDWLAKTPPVVCFKLEGGMYRQAAYGTPCTVCSAIYMMPIKQAKFRFESSIYGDEAFREVDNKTILCYSFVGYTGSKKSAGRLKDEFDGAKKYLAPSIKPDDWILHVTEVLSPEKRKKSGYLSHLDQDRARKGIRMALRAIAKYSAKRVLQVYTATSVVDLPVLKGDLKVRAQSSVYNSALMRVISEYTENGLAPMFYFERTGTDGWAKNLFDGGRLTLLWARLTNGVPVKSPEFVEPSHSYYLEMADIVSYVVARELFTLGRRVSGNPMRSGFDTSLLGRVRYIWEDGDHGWNYYFGCGLPFSKMFANTEWGAYI